MNQRSIWALCLCLAIAFGLQLRPPHSLQTLQKRGVAEEHEAIQFTLYLKQKNLAEFKAKFAVISDPTSESYRSFLKPSEVEDLLRADDEAFEAVRSWVAPHASSVLVKEGSDHVTILTNVATASQLLGTTFGRYQRRNTKQVTVRITSEASIPTELDYHVEVVTGLNDFPQTVKVEPLGNHRVEHLDESSRKRQTSTLVPIAVSPALLKRRYNVPSGLQGNQSTNINCVVAFADFYSANALQAFNVNFTLAQPNITVFGNNCLTYPQPCDQVESNLDVQYLTSLSPGLPLYFDANSGETDFLTWATGARTKFGNSIPHTFSISYVAPEIYYSCDFADPTCNATNANYFGRFDTAVQALATLGSSVLAAAGDDGALGNPNLQTYNNCPADTSTYCPGGGCYYNASSCQQVLVLFRDSDGNSLKCILPTSTSPECLYLFYTATLLNDVNAWLANNTACGVDVDQSPANGAGLIQLVSNCTCDKLKYGVYGNVEVRLYNSSAVSGPAFTSVFPASCPSVTSLGSTVWIQPGNLPLFTQVQEIPTSYLNQGTFDGGGGFSYYYEQPSYQTSFVNNWISQIPTLPNAAPTTMFDRTKRAYPDVAFNGAYYIIYSESNSTTRRSLIGGTSASTPAFTGLVALINDALIAKKEPTLGFLNPLLYQIKANYSQSFVDIDGSVANRCNRLFCCKYGFTSAPGWDPNSGLGTPNFDFIYNLIVNNNATISSSSSRLSSSGSSGSNGSSSTSTMTNANVSASMALVPTAMAVLLFLGLFA